MYELYLIRIFPYYKGQYQRGENSMKTLLMMTIIIGTLLKFIPAVAQTKTPRIVPTSSSKENDQSSPGVDPNLSSHQEKPDQLAAVFSIDPTSGDVINDKIKPISLSETCCGPNVVHTALNADPNLFIEVINDQKNKEEENNQ